MNDCNRSIDDFKSNNNIQKCEYNMSIVYIILNKQFENLKFEEYVETFMYLKDLNSRINFSCCFPHAPRAYLYNTAVNKQNNNCCFFSDCLHFIELKQTLA